MGKKRLRRRRRRCTLRRLPTRVALARRRLTYMHKYTRFIGGTVRRSFNVVAPRTRNVANDIATRRVLERTHMRAVPLETIVIHLLVNYVTIAVRSYARAFFPAFFFLSYHVGIQCVAQ